MNTIFGYARTSTVKQRIERQISNIKEEFPDAIIVSEKFTGTTLDRPNWSKLYKEIVKRAGQGESITLVYDEISRMSRNAEEGFQLYKELFEMGVRLVFLKERHLDTDVYRKALETKIEMTGGDIDLVLTGINQYLYKVAERQIIIAFEQAEKEVDYLHKRTSEGVRKAQERYFQEEVQGIAHEKRLPGRQTGSKVETKKAQEKKQEILKHSKSFNGTLTDADCMKLTRLSRNTFYKYKRELLQTM